MKKTIFSIKYLLHVLVFTGLAVIYACDVNSDSGGGQPEISLVRHVHPDSAATSTVEQVGPGETFVIEGNNLKNTDKVYLNGIEASFNPLLVTNSQMIITEPGDMPFGDMDPNNDEMKTIKLESRFGITV